MIFFIFNQYLILYNFYILNNILNYKKFLFLNISNIIIFTKNIFFKPIFIKLFIF